MDLIKIENLKVFAYHGVYESEREKGQNFFVNATLHSDLRDSAVDDDVESTTDYAAVCQTIKDEMTLKTYSLIETVAERVAQAILVNFTKVDSVDIEIKKPQAPVPMEFDSISVKISRGWSDAYLSYGSNLGDREENIEKALFELCDRNDCKMVQNSSLIETKPYGNVVQDDFLNGACYIKTLLRPMELLDVLHELENDAGRVRDVHWGPRTLDMDIIFYDDLIYDSDDLIIPHVDIENREFVLRPMAEIAPYKRHPIFRKTMQEMLDELINKR